MTTHTARAAAVLDTLTLADIRATDDATLDKLHHMLENWHQLIEMERNKRRAI